MPQWLLVLITALLSSGATLAGAYLWYRFYLERLLDRELDELAVTMETRVKQGVLAAGEELLPAFREEVREGFREAMTHAASGGLIDDTAKEVVSKGSRIVESSLDILFGKSKKKSK